MRLGVIGPGLIWQKKHKSALAKLANIFSISAFCAASERLKAETLHDYPNAAYQTDLQAFVKRDDIDAVVVLTPIQMNAPAALAALRAGKDVFLEKPMAHSVQAGLEVLEVAQQTGRHVWVLENAVYQPVCQILKNIIAENQIGDPLYFNHVAHSPIDAYSNDCGGYGKTRWRIQPEYPLGALLDGGVHTVAILSTIFGMPEWVFATGSKLRPEFGEYDHIVMQLGYSGQLKGILSHSSTLGEKHNSFTIWGSRGSVVIEDHQLIVETDQGEIRQIELSQLDMHDEMWSAFERSITRNEPPPYTLAHAWGDLATLMAVGESIKTGQKGYIKLDR
ncbi:MAG: Gfo/Idh/MocA family oxidoreductase [Chloroflexota bacterium]